MTTYPQGSYDDGCVATVATIPDSLLNVRKILDTTSRIWAYASSKRAANDRCDISGMRKAAKACAGKTLGGYTGVVVSDGYSGYNVLNGAIRAGCWAHARRKWVEAMSKGVTLENALAAKGLDYCSKLFEVEQKLENLSDAERREQRRLHSGPIVEAYYAWLQAIFKPTGKLKKAITYSLNQREYLCAFLDHGEIEISNNQVERHPPDRGWPEELAVL